MPAWNSRTGMSTISRRRINMPRILRGKRRGSMLFRNAAGPRAGPAFDATFNPWGNRVFMLSIASPGILPKPVDDHLVDPAEDEDDAGGPPDVCIEAFNLADVPVHVSSTQRKQAGKE